MRAARTLSITLLAALACGVAPAPVANAAESYDNCTGFIDALPATVSAQGTWCLRKDLATAITSGSAISINANNVTLDCNGFKLGGLAAGTASTAYGVMSQERQNVAVRNCSIRGFHYGIYLYGGAGHAVEANRLDNNLAGGIYMAMASNSVIRGNRVHDTGGFANNNTRHGIYAYGGDSVEVTENVVVGVLGTPGYYNDVIGIFRGNYIDNVDRASAYIARNRVSGLTPAGSGKFAWGFRTLDYGGTGGQMLIEGNYFSMPVPITGSYGISCFNSFDSVRNNTVQGFPTGITNTCLDDGGNVVH